MGYWMVKVGGTKTLAANSTPGDWTTTSNFFNSLADAITKGADNADHEIVLYDETHTITSLNFGTANATSGTNWIISSAGGDPDNCIVSATTTTAAPWRLGRDLRIYNYEFNGIGFTRTEENAADVAGLIQVEHTITGNLVFNDCKFFDADNTYDGVGSKTHFRAPAPTTSPRSIEFNDCVFDNLTGTHTGGYWLMNFTAGNDVVFDGVTISNCDGVATGDGVVSSGGIGGGGNFTFLDCEVDTCTQTHQSTTEISLIGLINAEGTLTIDGMHVHDCVQTGGTGGDIVRAYSTFDVRNMLFERNVSTPGSDIDSRWNSAGGGFRAITDAAQGVGDNIVSIDCVSDHGTALYAGDGAGGTWTNIYAINCESRAQGNIYFGGWGDNIVDGFAVIGGHSGTVEVTDEGDGTTAVYAHLRPAGSTRSKITNLSNGYISGCRNALGLEPGICIKNESGTYAHTSLINNVILDNPGSVAQIRAYENAGGIVNMVVNASVVDRPTDGAFVDEREAPTGTLSLAINSVPRTVTRGVVVGGGVSRTAL